MKIRLDIPWQRYALIAKFALLLQKKKNQFGKTVLQKMVYLLQEVFKVDCGYDFEFYTYGPFTSRLLHDLDFVEHIGGVRVHQVNSLKGGYHICPGEKAAFLCEKGKNFLHTPRVKNALKLLVDEFGNFGASDLELRSTIIYVEREFQSQHTLPDVDKIVRLVKELKQKFTIEEIQKTVDGLNSRSYIMLNPKD